jgi:hypothetical protein
VRFGGGASAPTLVVNAANANTGRATRLCRAPVVVDVPARPQQRDDGFGDDLLIDGQGANGADGTAGGNDIPRASRRLLAVDLGLRTGMALYDGSGSLLQYAQYPNVPDATSLGALAEAWLSGEAPTDEQVFGTDIVIVAGEGMAGDQPGEVVESMPVTHLAIEGSDVELRDEWDAAAVRVASRAEGGVAAHQFDVTPSMWRHELLLPKERRSSNTAKAAARLIARQIVADRGARGIETHEGRFPTDVAEAALVGYFAVRRLGWYGEQANAGPPVRRFMNGAVVQPTTPTPPTKRQARRKRANKVLA